MNNNSFSRKESSVSGPFVNPSSAHENMGVSMATPIQQTRKPMVVVAMDDLNARIQHLHERLSFLEERLRPVMSDSPAKPQDNPGAPQANCMLTGELYRMNNDITVAEQRVARILDSLEI
jgi:hypothetical protein